jgi:hypothetical protein
MKKVPVSQNREVRALLRIKAPLILAAYWFHSTLSWSKLHGSRRLAIGEEEEESQTAMLLGGSSSSYGIRFVLESQIIQKLMAMYLDTAGS